MTDYLEQLLEEQEEEQRAREWKWPAIGRNGEFAQRVQPAQTEESVPEQEKQAKSDLTQGVRSVPEQAEPELISGGESAAELLGRQTGRLRRAVEQMQRQVRGRPFGETDIAPGRDSRMPGADGAIPRAVDYAALVDAAFARDARRYDGPLGLL